MSEPNHLDQAATVRAVMAAPFDELAYLRAKLEETTATALRLEAEVARLTAERDRIAAILRAAGFTPCSAAACNCGGWHGGHAEALRSRLRHVAQMLIEQVGAGGPMDAEAAAERTICVLMEREVQRDEARAERDRWQQVAVQNGVAAGRLGGDALSLQDAVRDASLERDAYRAFAVRIATALASPGAEDLAAKIRLGDLDRLAEMVEERLSDPLPEDDRALFARQREAIGLLAAERDRLALTLRCERGEWAPDAPEGAGWTWRPEDWEWTGVAGARSEDGEPTNLYVRHRAYWGDEDDQDDNAWTWLVVETIGMGDEGDALASGTAPTALEAIEACDAAIREVRGD